MTHLATERPTALNATNPVNLATATLHKLEAEIQHSKVETQCSLWMAESSTFHRKMGLFLGKNATKGDLIADADVLVPIFDHNPSEYSAWHDFNFRADIQDDLHFQNSYETTALLAGIWPNLICSTELANVKPVQDDLSIAGWPEDHKGVHRSKEPTAGSFTYRSTSPMQADKDLSAGQELFYACKRDPFIDPTVGFSEHLRNHMHKPLEALEKNGVCIDSPLLKVKQSSIPGAGKGLFAQAHMAIGDSVAVSPVILFDRSQVEILRQFVDNTLFLRFTEGVESKNLILNYCYGHPDSNLLFFPFGSKVNYINHSREKANVRIVWSGNPLQKTHLFSWTKHQLLGEDMPFIFFEYFAIRDIEPGEEILIDYGDEWIHAWETHLKEWKAPENSKDYVSAHDYRQQQHEGRNGYYFRTIAEQRENPYPENILTACYFDPDVEISKGDSLKGWKKRHSRCLRPCVIRERSKMDTYKVDVFQVTRRIMIEGCELETAHVSIQALPADGIRLVDKAYTADQFLVSAFRHEIGIPSDMFPTHWMRHDLNPEGDFLDEKLEVNQLATIKWKADGTTVTPHAYLMRIPSTVREGLLDYCNRIGITEQFRELTYRGNSLGPGEEESVVFNQEEWLIQRPESQWNSNMHWISPMDADSQLDYLRALSDSGFDTVLQAMGEELGFDGLAAYHVTFIAVSHCQQGFIHYDVDRTGAKTFNMIIPLILANETGPELDLQSASRVNGAFPVGRLRYKYDIASLMGDGAFHATSAVDYRSSKQMRMAATVYVADISKDNIEAILSEYTQDYPPPDEPELLLAMAGTHWKRGDPSVKLPVPPEDWRDRAAHDVDTNS